MDDLHGISHILPSSLWPLDHYWLLHCKLHYLALNKERYAIISFLYSSGMYLFQSAIGFGWLAM